MATLKQMLQNGDVVMRLPRLVRRPPGGPRLHAIRPGGVFAVCGFVPSSGEWIESQPNESAGKCSICLRQLRRAGFDVSWAGVIVRAEVAAS